MPQIKIERAWWRPAAVISSAAVAIALTTVPTAALADEVAGQPSEEPTKQEQVISETRDDSTPTSTSSTSSSTPINNEGGSGDLVDGVNGGASGSSPSSESGAKPGNVPVENGGSTSESDGDSGSLPNNDVVNDVSGGTNPVDGAGATEKNDGNTAVDESGTDNGDIVDVEGAGTKSESPDADSVNNGAPSANNSLISSVTGDSQGSAEEEIESNKTVDTGIYAIGAGVDSNKVLDVPNGQAVDGTNIQIWDSNGNAAQKWQVTWHEEDGGYYTIGLAGTTKVLDVQGANAYDGATVWLYEDNGTVAQRWLIKNEGGMWSILSLLGDFYLDVSCAGTSNGTKIWLFSGNGTNSQKFNFYQYSPEMPGNKIELPDGDGVYIIKTAGDKSGNMVLDVSSGSFNNCANVQIYESNDTAAQRFYFERDAEGFYTITNLGSGKVLDLASAGILPTTNVQQYDSNKTDAQKWAIIASSDGECYFLINKLTGLALDVSGASFSNCSNVWGYTFNESIAQSWLLEKSSYLEEETIYVIHSALDPSEVLDIEGASSFDGTKVKVYESNNTIAQRFEIVAASGGGFHIRTAASGGYLTVSNGKVVQSVKNESKENTWNAVWTNGFYSLISNWTDSPTKRYALTVSLDGTIVINEVNEANASRQHFFFVPSQLIADGYYVFTSALDDDLVLDVANGSLTNESNVQVFTQNDSNAQKFHVVWTGEGYKITAARTNYALDVHGAGVTNGTNVWLYESNNSDAQLWTARIADGGGIVFVSRNAQNMALDVQNGWTFDGANVQIFEINGSKSQTWRLSSTTVPYGWVQEGSTWKYYDRNGNMLTDSIVAYNLYQQIKDQYSDTNYLIAVDAVQCHVVLFQGSAGNWELVFDALAGTGDPYLASTDTDGYGVTGEGGNPWGSLRGYFKLGSTTTGYTDSNGRREYDSADQLKWFRSIYMDYGFHSTCGNYSDPSQVGKRISHGCIRMLEQYAKMIYDLPTYTMVAVLPSYNGGFQVDQR